MTDIFTKAERSRIMSRVTGKNTKPEILVRKMIHAMGFRFRIHRKDLPGRPDIVLPRFHKAIFVHGCFWHGHKGCIRATRPTTNTDFWNKKIDSNMKRDRRNKEALKKDGWESLAIWACQLQNPETITNRIFNFLGESKSKKRTRT